MYTPRLNSIKIQRVDCDSIREVKLVLQASHVSDFQDGFVVSPEYLHSRREKRILIVGVIVETETDIDFGGEVVRLTC